MARIDKYDPVDGGFRAPLAGAWVGSATPKGVGLDANGRVVPGAGNSGIKGVLCKPDNGAAGDIVDVMTEGELVEFAGVAGTSYYAANADGVLDAVAPVAGVNKVTVGFTVEATRLVVRVKQVQG
jgi:hypothetical protein